MKITTSASVRTHTWARRGCLGLGALGVAGAVLAAPAAADPVDPALPAVATDTPVAPIDPSVAPAGPSAAATGPSAAPAPVQHLSSPDNLPPGTTADTPPQGRLSYLRDLLHAVRTQDVSGSDALLLLTQRPLDAGATPPPGMSASPSGPVGTSAVPPAADTTTPAPVGQ
ncbi:hypothetical protein ORI20_06115 [Mycobacterium sp. CVI_P3]|uniref:Uncharacterized protein n=1 Tax=Mycobacterium pinniadriaticum TaxID=2994102 RepID=A0ABT3SAG7_9MYCO|nr:hypothetical protein [Mycobacterium pinniadriaticum]MCX2929837.1 hypothetical protein [Mycobacterium pinniadriaticum]MCX2936514.1 hypothetical protein [Mycobacterium pinniadriaticum]